MRETTVTTGVDDLLVYLKGKDSVAMQEVATALNVPMQTLQAWTDFLVEEKILGIEYKFTKPYIYINKEEKTQKGKVTEKPAQTLDEIKLNYKSRAREKQIPENKILELWKAHVLEALSSRKVFFYEQASRRKLMKTDQLWQDYQKRFLAKC